MKPSEGNTDEDQCRDKDKKDKGGEFRCGEEIVRPPAERLRVVAVQSKTKQKPYWEDEPSAKAGVLPVPDIERDDRGKGKGFEQIGQRGNKRTCRLRGFDQRAIHNAS